MNKEDVPQDRAKAFEGRSKALYALDENGRYRVVPSNGWEVEEIVLEQAIAEFEREATAALARVHAGESSPLEYHMYKKRMDPLLLAQSTGFFRWQVKRHLRARAFAAISQAKKRRYADALGLSIAELETIP
jgi:hypothetical protein